MAVQGKLVPQDPSDEPAHILLERIRAEKARLIKEKKIKKEKNPSAIYRGTDNLHYEKFADGMVKCIEDEIPFEIPESWAWCRLGNISDNIQYGLSNSTEKVGTCRFLRITDIQNGGVDWDTVPFTNTNELDKYLLHINDILFARTGGTVGKSFLVSHLPFDSVFASYLIRVQLTNDISAQYIYWFFNSPTYWEQITCKTVGTGQPNCNGASLRNLLIPLPPLDEQYRILNKLAEIRPLIEDYSVTYNRIQDVHKGFPDKIKQSVLQWAVQGKLIQQDENDEPASMLLERIRAEKEELIKQGKIKRDKRESVIYQGADNSYYERFADGSEKCIDEEIQFDIPEHWVWCRLREITLSIRDGSHNPPPDNGSGIPLLSGVNIDNNFINIHSATRWITQSEWEIENRRTNIECGDVLLTIVGTIGRSAVVETDEHFALQRSVAVLKPCQIFSVYLMNVLQAPTTQRWFSNNGKGTAQKGIYLNMLYKLMIPIPPLQEQVKISEALNVLMDRINDIENQIA